MALTPLDEQHALQIQAGILGRQAGHKFEDQIAEIINNAQYPIVLEGDAALHLYVGNPAHVLLNYIARSDHQDTIVKAVALSTGALATSEAGKQWLNINGVPISRCKSDIIITLTYPGSITRTAGVSTKQCNNRTPTNAQLYFTTARGFANLLKSNDIPVSDAAISALRQFCGDNGYRPLDLLPNVAERAVDPRRFFWEELDERGRHEWEEIFSTRQDAVTRLLLQKAYLEDPFAPDFLLHKTKRAAEWTGTELAIYRLDELIVHSKNYSGFCLRPYSVRKGSYKDPPGTQHMAPRFGIVQMQRGGQAQHPEQLQFNLEAGYFYKLSKHRPDMSCDRAGE